MARLPIVRVAHVHPATGEVIRVSMMERAADGSFPELERRRADGRLRLDLERHHRDMGLPPPDIGLIPNGIELGPDERCAPHFVLRDRGRVVKGRTERFEHPQQDLVDAEEADRAAAIEMGREYEAAVTRGEIVPPMVPTTIEEIVESRVAEEIARRVADGTIEALIEAEVAKRT